MSFSQTALESELRSIVNQDKSTENSYIDSLFHLTYSANDETITDRVDRVLNRHELLVISKNYEKVAQVYDNGKPIVKSIKNRLTRVTYWNQFHDNGNVKYTGYSSGYLLQIGNWEEFDENGKLVKSINHESNRISFVKIHKRAVDLGISMNDIDFSYSPEDRLWIIKDWTAGKKYVIDINLKTKIESLN